MESVYTALASSFVCSPPTVRVCPHCGDAVRSTHSVKAVVAAITPQPAVAQSDLNNSVQFSGPSPCRSIRSAQSRTLASSDRHARQGKARQGKARQGKARQGKARQGKARQGMQRCCRTVQTCCSAALCGSAWQCAVLSCCAAMCAALVCGATSTAAKSRLCRTWPHMQEGDHTYPAGCSAVLTSAAHRASLRHLPRSRCCATAEVGQRIGLISRQILLHSPRSRMI